MRFLVDNALSPLVAEILKQAGYRASHVRDHGLQNAPDEEIFDFAAREGQTIVSADTDFGTLLAIRNTERPSVILFRRITGRRPEGQARLLLDQLPALEEHIEDGSVAVIDLQGELKEILERGAREGSRVDAVELARRIREKIAARHGGPFEMDSVDIIREMRDSER